MTTLPPPPPAGSPPPLAPSPHPPPAGDGRRPWWSAGRVIAAIVIVLVLMAGSATAGFVLGASFGAFETVTLGNGGVFDDLQGEDLAPWGVPGEGPEVEGAAVRLGGTVQGRLEEGVVVHRLAVETTTDVTIELHSDDFDTVLQVIDPDDAEIGYSDDVAIGEDTDSRVDLTLEPGTYRLRVSAFGFTGGGYELEVR